MWPSQSDHPGDRSSPGPPPRISSFGAKNETWGDSCHPVVESDPKMDYDKRKVEFLTILVCPEIGFGLIDGVPKQVTLETVFVMAAGDCRHRRWAGKEGV